MSTVIWVLLIEWVATAVGAMVFLGLFGPPWAQPDRPVAWHLWSMGVLAIAESLTLAAIAIGWRIPVWVFAAVYGFSTAITYWRLWLVLLPRLRRRRPS